MVHVNRSTSKKNMIFIVRRVYTLIVEVFMCDILSSYQRKSLKYQQLTLLIVAKKKLQNPESKSLQ